MKEMKTQLILFSLLLLGSTAWAQQPCLSQDAYREKVEAYSQILKQQKLKTLASSEARKIAHTGFLPKIDVNADGTLNMSDLSAWNEPVGEYPTIPTREYLSYHSHSTQAVRSMPNIR